MEGVRLENRQWCHFKLVYDDRCPLVRRLARLVKWWDRHHTFDFIGWHTATAEDSSLLGELERCPWSLLLVDDHGERWQGPEAIPIILKSLPSGKLAAVLYILPGTMWLTRHLYMMVSANRRRLSAPEQAT